MQVEKHEVLILLRRYQKEINANEFTFEKLLTFIRKNSDRLNKYYYWRMVYYKDIEECLIELADNKELKTEYVSTIKENGYGITETIYYFIKD